MRIKNKMIIGLMSVMSCLLLPTLASAQQFNLGNCNVVIDGFANCKATLNGSGNSGTPYTPKYAPDSNVNMGNVLGGNPIGNVPNVDSFFTNVPGGNVFAFCSGARPGKHSPWRGPYDFICPKGQVSGGSNYVGSMSSLSHYSQIANWKDTIAFCYKENFTGTNEMNMAYGYFCGGNLTDMDKNLNYNEDYNTIKWNNVETFCTAATQGLLPDWWTPGSNMNLTNYQSDQYGNNQFNNLPKYNWRSVFSLICQGSYQTYNPPQNNNAGGGN